MAGRKPKPTAMKALHGNPGKRPMNKQEPKFAGVPVCPIWLSPVAKTEWKRIWSEVAELELLKATDQMALASYCQSYARWQSAEKIVDKEGQTVNEPITGKPNKEGQVDIIGHKIKRHPATIIAKDEKMAMSKLASLLGFDPSSRSRIQVPDGAERPKDDDTLDYLGLDSPGTGTNTKIH
jgi:P27 family predicted phage terminase small subunit